MASPLSWASELRKDATDLMNAWEKLKADQEEFDSRGGLPFVDGLDFGAEIDSNDLYAGVISINTLKVTMDSGAAANFYKLKL